MHADEPARVAAGAARLLAEARRERAVLERQLAGVQHLAGVDVRQLHLGRGDEVQALGGVEQVFLELRQLAGAGERLGVGHGRAPPFLVAARRVRVGHEVDEGALQAGAQAAQQDEAAGGQLHRALEVDDAQLGAQVPVRLHLEAFGDEVARRAPTAHFGVVVLVVAHRRGVGRHVRRGQQQLAQGLVGRFALGADGGNLVVDGAHALLGGLGLVFLPGGHHGADGFRRGVALGLQSLFLRDGGAARLVELGEARGIPRSVAVLHRLGDGFLVIANEFDV